MNSTTNSQARLAQADSHLTLHYKLSLLDSGEVVINTFDSRPATVQLGLGQMAEPLERCLLGLAEGEHRRFDLAPEAAFGPRNPQLVQTLSRSVLDQHSGNGERYAPGDLVDFPAPGGGRFAGVLKSLDERQATFDFNHPLAGRAVRFEVQLLGVL